MDAKVQTVIEALRRRGFAKLSGVVRESIVARLQEAGRHLEQHEPTSWAEATRWYADGEWRPTYFADAGASANYYDSLGVDPGFDAAVEDLLETPAIRELLDDVVGADRRMWFVQLRWAVPGSEEYPVHQDVYGELGLCLYLTDHADEAGSMVLWPRSHLWPRLLEAFPLALPAWMKGCLDRVDGVAGDICVFFNKTWHGRTSAKGAPRLVMLISFLPPGPYEKPRRLPAAARTGLGPELRKITDPQAARPFAAPPSDPHLSTWIEQPANCPFTEEVDQVCREYAWDWSRYGAGSENDASPLGALRRYKTFVRQTATSAVVPANVAHAILDGFRLRSDAQGYSPRTFHYLSMLVALWNVHVGAARREHATWRELPRDELCDSVQDEAASSLRLHADLGEDTSALQFAAPLFARELSEDIPGTAWSASLLPFVRQQQFAAAKEAHSTGLPQVSGNPAHLDEVGRHLEYLALLADPQPALELIGQHTPAFGMPHYTGALWRFWSGAWTLFARLDRAGTTEISLALPRLGAHHTTKDLANRFRGYLQDLAARLDGRNANTFRHGLMDAIEERLGWAALPATDWTE